VVFQHDPTGAACRGIPSKELSGRAAASNSLLLLILIALSEGEQRWSTLRRCADGISEKMLAQTLQTLERDGLVHRNAQAVTPPRVDYTPA
jgi:DNA-binding HxlR family transcriptional regulator